MGKITIKTYNLQQLKDLLDNYGLSTEGNKDELFARLQKHLGQTVDRDPSESEPQTSQPTLAVELKMSERKRAPSERSQQEMDDNKSEAKPEVSGQSSTSRQSEPPMDMMAMLKSLLDQQTTKLDSKLDQQSAELAKQNAEFATKLDAKLDQQSAEVAEKLDQQSAESARQNEELAKQFVELRTEQADFRREQNTQLAELRAELLAEIEGGMQEVDGRVKELENKIKELELRLESRSSNTEGSPQQNSTDIVRETVSVSQQQNSTNIARETVFTSSRGILKPPTFDGETPFENFKVQFQAAVRHNGWSSEEQLNALIVALRDKAADVLQTICATEMSCERILGELELRYGQSHTQELCKIQLHNRRQQRGESLQDLEREVTKLARQAYGKVPLDVLNGLTVDAFIHAVRDDHLKLHLRTNTRGKTMNEVLASALEYDAARASLFTDSVRLRKLDAEDIAQIEALIDKRMKRPTQGFQRSTRRRSRSRSLCFKCQQPGHFQRDCKVAMRKPTMTQPDNREGIRQVEAERQDEGEQLRTLFNGDQGN